MIFINLLYTFDTDRMTKTVRHVKLMLDDYEVSTFDTTAAIELLRQHKPLQAIAITCSTSCPNTFTVLHPFANGANKVLAVSKDVRYGHAADMTSIQEMLDRVAIPHHIFDGHEESLVVIPKESMPLVGKLFECNAILFA